MLRGPSSARSSHQGSAPCLAPVPYALSGNTSCALCINIFGKRESDKGPYGSFGFCSPITAIPCASAGTGEGGFGADIGQEISESSKMGHLTNTRVCPLLVYFSLALQRLTRRFLGRRGRVLLAPLSSRVLPKGDPVLASRCWDGRRAHACAKRPRRLPDKSDTASGEDHSGIRVNRAPTCSPKYGSPDQ